MPEPFLKWAGGKRWLIQRYRNLFPEKYGRYVEPFLGGGAVFFELLPREAILADANEDLINAYRCVKTDHIRIDAELRKLHESHTETQYYRIRTMSFSDPVERAVRLIYLNRTCFNGLYRVNRCGQFNVPMGAKTQVEFPNGYLAEIAGALRSTRFRVADFQSVLDETGDGDFVFLDPPYTVMHNTNNFIKYNAALFSWEDQVRLASAAKRAVARGALVMVANADHASVRSLYGNVGRQHRVERASVLASHSDHRRRTTELIITSY